MGDVEYKISSFHFLVVNYWLDLDGKYQNLRINRFAKLFETLLLISYTKICLLFCELCYATQRNQ